VAHPLALGGGAASDERDLRDVAQVLARPRGRGLLGGPADLADEHDRIGLVVGREQLEGIEEGRADDRVPCESRTIRSNFWPLLNCNTIGVSVVLRIFMLAFITGINRAGSTGGIRSEK
jgi:hypothetical protein